MCQDQWCEKTSENLSSPLNQFSWRCIWNLQGKSIEKCPRHNERRLCSFILPLYSKQYSLTLFPLWKPPVTQGARSMVVSILDFFECSLYYCLYCIKNLHVNTARKHFHWRNSFTWTIIQFLLPLSSCTRYSLPEGAQECYLLWHCFCSRSIKSSNQVICTHEI